MKGLQIDRTGSLDVLAVRDVAEPQLGSGDVRIRVEAAGVNPSDVGIVLGRFPQLTLPRILGRDFAGIVVDGPSDLIGSAVWGTGGGELGLTRDGAHAETLVLPSHAVATRPAHLSAESAAAMGTPYLTAFSIVVDVAQVASGEYVIVSGAAGSVGIVAVQFVKALGANPIALVLPTDDVSMLERIGVAAIVRSGQDDLANVTRDLTGGKGADVALNAVGAPIFAALVDALGKGGRMVIFSAAAGKEVQFDLFAFYRKRLTFYGFDSAAFTLEHVAGVLQRVSPYVESKAVVPQQVTERYPLAQAREAYEKVNAGAQGKIVINP